MFCPFFFSFVLLPGVHLQESRQKTNRQTIINLFFFIFLLIFYLLAPLIYTMATLIYIYNSESLLVPIIQMAAKENFLSILTGLSKFCDLLFGREKSPIRPVLPIIYHLYLKLILTFSQIFLYIQTVRVCPNTANILSIQPNTGHYHYFT